jgi:hypothetical protein
MNNSSSGGFYGPDNSNGGYATLGLGYAVRFGCTIPQWVKTELNHYIGCIQDPINGDAYDGGSWYAYLGDAIGVNILKTGNLIFEMQLVGDTESTPRVVDALDYIARHWGDACGFNSTPGWNGDPANYQAMFTAMKGFEFMRIHDFNAIDWFEDFSDVIVAQQDANGSWQDSCERGDPELITEWALLTILEVGPPPGNPRVYIASDADTCVGIGETVTVDVACAYRDTGKPPATNVDLVVRLPAELTFVSATGSPDYFAPDSVVWHIGTMQVGDSVFNQIVTLVNNQAVPGWHYVVRAEVFTLASPDGADYVDLETDICVNRPPVALCKNVEVPADENCLADASIDNGSYDPDGDPITLTQSPPGPYPLGDTSVMLIVYDGLLADTCYATVTVIDITPPEITVELNRDVLWPPNHKMVDILADVTVTDNCCASPTFKLVSITSNEPDNGKGDGNTIGDIQGADPGTPDVAFQLRSERSGGGDGRIYTIVYEAQDCEGNSANATVTVRVPHDQSGMALASTGYTADGTGLDPSMMGFAIVILSTPTQIGLDAKGHSVVIAAAFDAMTLDPTRIYVGNTAGAIKPVRSLRVDNNNDGLGDLALFYTSADAGAIVFNSAVLTEDQKLEEDAGHGPVGLHYTDNGGVDYLVRNIFELGPSTPLGLPAEKRDPFSQDVISREDGDTQVPGARVNALGSAYPNPFNPSTTIPFELATAGRVSLQIFDTQGRLVRTLYNEEMPVGTHQAVWNGCDNSGSQVATGVYFVRFATGDYQVTRKLVMIK